MSTSISPVNTENYECLDSALIKETSIDSFSCVAEFELVLAAETIGLKASLIN